MNSYSTERLECLLEGFEEEAEEDVQGEEDKREDDGASQTTPCAHAIKILFLLGFLFCGFAACGRT